VQRVLPEAVSEHDGILAVKYTEIIPLLIEAIKELKNHVDHKFESLLPLWAEKNAEIAQLKARADQADAESAQLKAESAQLRAALCSKFPDLPVCIQ